MFYFRDILSRERWATRQPQTCWSAGYIYLGGQLVAEYKDGTTYFFHRDHLGSTRLLTRVDQSILDSMDYLPYGEQIAGDTGSTHKFTGKERDGESGLDEFGARYYSSSLGRFMIPDWAAKPVSVPYAEFGNPQSLNLYAYVRNDPLANADPDGHCPDGMDVCFMPKLAQDPNYMAGQQKGAEVGALTLGAGVVAAGVLAEGGVLLTLARNLLGAGLAAAASPAGQNAMQAVGDILAPPGYSGLNVPAAAEAFGFKSFEQAGGLAGGELKNGGVAAVEFSKTGSQLGVGVSFARGPAGTLKEIESGAVNAAKASGADSVKITAKMVVSSMERLLKSQGFTQEMKNGKATGVWSKTIKLVEKK